MLKNITIGSDPEFLVYNPSTGLCAPGISFTDGTKELPEDIGGGFFIQKDNALLEGNIPPCRDKGHFVFNMNYLINHFRGLVAPNGLQIDFKDSGDYDLEDLDHPDLHIFGCDPFNNAWEEGEIKAPDLSEVSYRTCGFHIHIGYSLETDKISKEIFDKLITRAFDLKVILPSYLLHFDERRALAYGGIGQYREKSYGVECRSLGSYFTHPDRLGWVWDRVMDTIDFCKSEENLSLLENLKKPEISDSKLIKEYLKDTLKLKTV